MTTTTDDDQIEQPDLLASLQRELERAKADLAAERARTAPARTESAADFTARVAKAKATRAVNAARVPYRRGDRVRINTPRSPRYHGQEVTITGINSDVDPGEVQALGVWFALTEITRLPKTNHNPK